MQPGSSTIGGPRYMVALNDRERAMWWYTGHMQLGLLCRKRLRLESGMVARAGVDEILLVCRKQGGGPGEA